MAGKPIVNINSANPANNKTEKKVFDTLPPGSFFQIHEYISYATPSSLAVIASGVSSIGKTAVNCPHQIQRCVEPQRGSQFGHSSFLAPLALVLQFASSLTLQMVALHQDRVGAL